MHSEGQGGRRSGGPIEPLTTTSDWTSATDAGSREAAAIGWLRFGQAETGYEHAVVLTKAGELVHAGSSGLKNRVRIPATSPGIDLVIHHSHPGENSLSLADFGTAWSRSKGSEARAYSPDGSSFFGRALVDPARWMQPWRKAFGATASELRIIGRRDRRSYAYLAEHVVNAEMEKVGLVWYKASLAGSAQADMASLTKDLPALRAAVRRELKGDD